MMDEEMKAFLELRVYDVINLLGNQMCKNKTTEEYVEIEALNGFSNKWNNLKIILTEKRND